LKYKQRQIEEGPGNENSQISMRYAIVMNKVTDLYAKVCKTADSSKEFLEEIQKLQEKYVLKHRAQAPEGSQQHGEPLKDPPIIAAKSVKKGRVLKDNLRRMSRRRRKRRRRRRKRKIDTKKGVTW
jgi:hypothetical protein